MNEYATSFGNSAADALPADRAKFIRKTYLLLAAAILAFVVIEFAIFATGYADDIAVTFLGSQYSWLIVLGAFMGVSFLANWWASSTSSSAVQYLGLGLYVVAEAVIFVPLIFIAAVYSDASVIPKAGIVTLGLFLGITATVFLTRTDFSFLGPIVAIGGFAALGFIAASILFGFSLGSIFAFVMVAFAGTAILYNTSKVLHNYNTNQHVAAALTLFAGIALLFWYILSIFSSRD
ncbi:MAG TPA: Bax inhibitor-1 family protein [Pyrinomonadaceae bacterium]|nr:Bax inhibitor-1 family protein [Pyrinomonadaceae bacterium]